jgi:hypothetical protein
MPPAPQATLSFVGMKDRRDPLGANSGPVPIEPE